MMPYSKSVKDELDLKLLDQLAGAVSQASGFCYDTKKFCVTTTFVVVTVLSQFTESKLDHSIFFAASIIPTVFWLLDSIGYYYQAKIRSAMESIRIDVVKRSDNSLVTPNGHPIISPERTNKTKSRKVRAALFNHSMWIYLIIVVIDAILWSQFLTGEIS